MSAENQWVGEVNVCGTAADRLTRLHIPDTEHATCALALFSWGFGGVGRGLCGVHEEVLSFA